MPSPNPMTRRDHRGGAAPATLTASINTSDASFSISTNTGWPTSGVGPFFVVIDPGTALEEKLLCTSQSASIVAVAGSGRGVDGTTAKSHSVGAVTYPCWTASEADELNEHGAAVAGVHGVSGSVVGTSDAQTLTNKSISGGTNTITGITQGAVANLTADLAVLTAADVALAAADTAISGSLTTHTASAAAHGATGAVVGTTNTQTLTNKSISGASNTLSNIPQAAVTGLASFRPKVMVEGTLGNPPRASGTALADSAQIFMSLAVGTYYQVVLHVGVTTNAGATDDFILDWAVTGTVTLSLSKRYCSENSAGKALGVALNTAVAYTVNTGATPTHHTESFIVYGGGSGGDLTMRWGTVGSTGTITLLADAVLTELTP